MHIPSQTHSQITFGLFKSQMTFHFLHFVLTIHSDRRGGEVLHGHGRLHRHLA